MKVGLAYIPEEDAFVGACVVTTAAGQQVPIYDYAHVGALADKLAMAMLRQEMRRQGIRQTDEVGFFGFVKKAWRKIKRTARKIARKIKIKKVFRSIGRAIKKVARVTKKIVNHPIVAAGVGVISAAVPGVGPIIGASYAGVRAAMTLADGVSRGDPRAVGKVAQYALNRTGAGQRALALVNSVRPVRAHSHNPWLHGAAQALGFSTRQLLSF